MTPINNASGIYFEELGALAKSTSYWRFIIIFDFTPFEHEEHTLLQRYTTLLSLCENLKKNFPWETCRMTMQVINSTLNEVIENNNILRQLFQPPLKTKRGNKWYRYTI